MELAARLIAAPEALEPSPVMMSLPTVLFVLSPSFTAPWLFSLPTEMSPLASVKVLAVEFLTTVREEASTAFSVELFVRVKMVPPVAPLAALPTVMSPRETAAY